MFIESTCSAFENVYRHGLPGDGLPAGEGLLGLLLAQRAQELCDAHHDLVEVGEQLTPLELEIFLQVVDGLVLQSYP